MFGVYKRMQELKEEVLQLLEDLRNFKELPPYERGYVLRRSNEVAEEYQALIDHILTKKKR